MFGTLNYEHFDDIMRVNVRGPISSWSLIENVKASAQKKIVMITSTIGTISTPEVAVRAFWYARRKRV